MSEITLTSFTVEPEMREVDGRSAGETSFYMLL